MAANFDPYHAWLAIPKGSRPVNHYQLLGLAPFVSEPPIINEAAEERIELVQKYLGGENEADARRLLDELAAAKKLLLQPAARKAYDAELRKQLGMAPAAETAPARAKAAADILPPAAAPATPPAAPVAPEPVMTAPTAPEPPMAAPPMAMPAMAAPVMAAPMMTAPAMAAPMMAAPGMAMPAQPMMAAPMTAAPMMAAPMMAAPVMAAPMNAGPMMAGPMMNTPTMAGPMMGGQMPGMGMAPSPFAQADAMSAAPSMRTSYRRRRSSGPQAAVMVIGAAVLLLVGVLVFAFIKMNPPELKVAGAPPPRTEEGPAEIGVSVPTTSLGPQKINPWAGTSGSSSGQKPSKQDDTVKKEVVKDVGSIMTAESPSRSTPKPDMASVKPEPPMAPKPVTPEPKPAPPKPEPTKVATSTPAKPPVVREPTKADAKELAAVTRNLTAMKAALAKRDMLEAQNQLDLATLEATAGDTVQAVSRSQQLLEGVKQFWHAVSEAVKGLNSTDELTIDGKTSIVIETGPDKLMIKDAGRNITYNPVSRMPTSLALFLAERWLNKGEAASNFVLGAFHAVDPKGSKDKAKTLFQQAQAGGMDVTGVLADLDAKE